MTLTRWSPVSGLAALEVNSLNRMFEAAFGNEAFSHGAWLPPVDILETAEGEVIVKAELPDLKREDIKITFENNILTIEGERKAEVTKPAPTAGDVEQAQEMVDNARQVEPYVDEDGKGRVTKPSPGGVR